MMRFALVIVAGGCSTILLDQGSITVRAGTL
jgi:hypothetical protein